MRRSRFPLLVTLLGAAACANAGETLTLPALPAGAIGVGVYFDRDG
jgi:hypothetical protein